MLSNQKPSGDKLGLGFNSFEASNSKSKEIKFVKFQKETSSGGGPSNTEGDPHKAQTVPKAIKGPPVCSPESEKSVSFQKSILGPRPKHTIVNNVKIPVASDNEICLGVDLESDEWIKDSGCSKHMTGNRKLVSTYKAYNGGNVIFGSNLRGLVLPCTLVVSFPAGYMVFLLVAHCYYWSLVVTAGSSRFVLALQTVSIGCVTFLLVVCAG
ncbi:hypothetical protein Tco_0044916 [Tanacetum coccineum]